MIQTYVHKLNIFARDLRAAQQGYCIFGVVATIDVPYEYVCKLHVWGLRYIGRKKQTNKQINWFAKKRELGFFSIFKILD